MRNNSTLKVLIFTRDHTNNSERLTIYARITVDGRRAEISLKRYVSVNDWDETRGRVIGFLQKALVLETKHPCSFTIGRALLTVFQNLFPGCFQEDQTVECKMRLTGSPIQKMCLLWKPGRIRSLVTQATKYVWTGMQRLPMFWAFLSRSLNE